MELVVRVDADRRTGTGHFMRCLALAQAVRDAGGAALFVTASDPGRLASRLDDEGIALERIGHAPGSRADAEAAVAIARGARAAWLVVDGYQFGDDYQRTIRDSGLRHLFVDDYGHCSSYCADLVLNQNIDADARLYRARSPETRLLLGTRFALLRREFRARTAAPDRGGDVPRLLVTLGGADEHDVTSRVLAAVARLATPTRTTALVGASNPHGDAIARAAGGGVEIVRDARDVAAILARTDLAVSAAGSTCWELAFFGVPSLLVVTADNQRGIARGLDEAKAARSLGWHADLGVERIADELERLLADGAARRAMAARARALVDGEGAARVVAAMRGAGA